MDKKLAEYLWTARWSITNNQNESAYEEISKALVYIGAEKSVDRPSSPPPVVQEPKIIEPTIVYVKNVKFDDDGDYQTSTKTFSGLVVHYSVSNRTAASAKAVLSWLASKNWGCMVMDEDGVIYVPEGWDFFKKRNDHAGTSKWENLTSVSRYFAGIEMCSWGKDSSKGPIREVTTDQGYVVAGKYQAYTEAQEKALVNFILWAKSKNPEFNLDNVVGHDELRREIGLLGDKQDPGGALSMPMPEFRKLIKARWKEING